MDDTALSAWGAGPTPIILPAIAFPLHSPPACRFPVRLGELVMIDALRCLKRHLVSVKLVSRGVAQRRGLISFTVGNCWVTAMFRDATICHG